MGSRRVMVGDGANIVLSGGLHGYSQATLSSYLDTLEASARELNSSAEETPKDLFNFDHNFLSTMPELRHHFSTPALFHPWGGEMHIAKLQLQAHK